MSGARANYIRQDLPPQGGFGKIDIKRSLPKRGFTGTQTVILGTVVFAVAMARVLQGKYERDENQREIAATRLAIAPLLDAEADRTYLRTKQEHLAFEKKVMANVKDWKVGESVYYNNDSIIMK